MNEQTAKLIEQLATKLGTTAEHLWAVLCRQAPLSAVTDLIVDITLLGLLAYAFRFVQRKTTVPVCKYDAPDWSEEGKFFAWVIYAALLATAIICFASDLPVIIAGFFNPEYWALKQILH